MSTKFRLYARVYNEKGILDEKNSGFVCLKPSPHLETLPSNAMIFEEKEKGHGSFEDWKKFFEEEYEEWKNITKSVIS